MKCPVCDGVGQIKPPAKRSKTSKNTTKADEMEFKSKAAKVLRKSGFSLREIAKLLGYKSVRSVQVCLVREVCR